MTPKELRKTYDDLYREADERFIDVTGDPIDHDEWYSSEFSSFIDDQFIPSITPENLDELIELSEHIYETNAESTVIDGSYGDEDILIDSLEALWKELLAQASEEQREAFRKWFFDQDQGMSELIILDPEEMWEKISKSS